MHGALMSSGRQKKNFRPFLELPEFQTFFCPFSVLRIFRFLALPEIAHFRFEISGNMFSAGARAENLVPEMFEFETRRISRTPQKDHAAGSSVNSAAGARPRPDIYTKFFGERG